MAADLVKGGDLIIATTTDNEGNTSEFSLTPISVRDARFKVDSNGDGSDSDLSDGDCATIAGVCTLRAAIEQAAFSFPNTAALIEFNLPAPVNDPDDPGLIIKLDNTLGPLEVTSRLFIDGTTQTCTQVVNGEAVSCFGEELIGGAAPIVKIDGTGVVSDALRITSDNNIVQWLEIRGFGGDAIRVESSGNDILNNLITDNDGDGVNFVGTDATANVVQGNTIDNNRGAGVRIEGAPGNTIGGPAEGTGNVLTINTEGGVYISGLTASLNTVQGNSIGVDEEATTPLGNGEAGVRIVDAPGNIIGGDAEGTPNTISGNVGDGVLITGSGATDNIVQGNFIGTDPTGLNNLGNGEHGVSIEDGASNNVIGRASIVNGIVEYSGAGNIIAFNSEDGVSVALGTGNLILSNSIFSNGNANTEDLGIDLSNGGNNLQSSPVLTEAHDNAHGNLLVEFFEADPSDNVEGKRLLATDVYTADDFTKGEKVFRFALTGIQPDNIVATTTDGSGNTSEFSNTRPVKHFLTFTVTSTDDTTDANGCDVTHCSIREAIQEANANVGGADLIEFDISGDGPHTIQPASPLPRITQPVVIDASSQIIELDGGLSTPGPGLHIIAGDSLMRGLVIGGFDGSGVRLERSASIEVSEGSTNGGSVIEGSVIGVSADGTTPNPNTGHGVLITNSDNNIVGGKGEDQGNTIAFNIGDGVFIESGLGNAVLSNSMFDNDGLGIDLGDHTANRQAAPVINEDLTGIDADGNLIVVYGVEVGDSVLPIRVQFFSEDGQTFLGEDAYTQAGDSTVNLGNASSLNVNDGDTSEFSPGVPAATISSSSGTPAVVVSPSLALVFTVNSTDDPGDGVCDLTECTLREAIEAANTDLNNPNERDAIQFDIPETDPGFDSGTFTIKPQSQLPDITDPLKIDGTTQLGFSDTPIIVVDGGGAIADGFVITTDDSALHSLQITGFSGKSVVVVSGTGNTIRSNSMSSIGGIGIDLNDDGITPNDLLDGDTGPNNFQNSPTLTSALIDPNADLVVLRYHVDSNARHAPYPLRVEFFSDGGQTFLGSQQYLKPRTTANINFDNASDLNINDGDTIIATATDADGKGNTSEFSTGVNGYALPDLHRQFHGRPRRWRL